MPQKVFHEYSPIYRRKTGNAEPEVDPIDTSRVVGGGITGGRSVTPTPDTYVDNRPVIGIVIAIIFLAFIAQYLVPQSQPTVSDGTSLQGHAMVGMTRDMLDTRVPELYADFLKNPITLVYRDRTWQPTSAELGISLDIRGTNNALLGLSIGSRNGTFGWLRTQVARWQGALDIGPSLIVDGPTLQRYLIDIAKEIDIPARPADIIVDPQSGRSQVLAAEDGRQLLVDETMLDVLQSITSAQSSTVAIRTRTITPAGNEQNVIQNAADAEQFLSAPLELRFGDQTWTWTKDEIIYLFTIEQRSDGVRVTPNEGAIALEVERLAKRINKPSKEPRIRLVDGIPTVIAPGVPGIEVDQITAVAAIRNAFYAEARTVNIPSKSVAPQLQDTDVAGLRFDDVLSTGRSSFAGSADYRITNIKAGVNLINGALIAPNSEFSFNTLVGEINEANGFVQGYAVVDNRTQLDWGGGICQVSTSVFRAAFYAALPITERHPHPFYISWYDAYAYPESDGPGLDAAIYTGEKDLKFVNDTGHWLMLDATIDDAQQILDIQLRGVATNREVKVTGPMITGTIPASQEPKYIDDDSLPKGVVKQTDKARDGMNIVVYREIIRDGKADPMREFPTSFAPWPNIYLRGTGGQSGTNPAP